jgi:hypothetical protein
MSDGLVGPLLPEAIVSVPSQPDNNPQPIHLFDQQMLARMLTGAGAQRVTFDYVLRHLIAVARVSER